MLLDFFSSSTLGSSDASNHTKIVNAPSSFYTPPVNFGNPGYHGLINPGYGYPFNSGYHNYAAKPGHVFVGYPNQHYNHGYNYPGYIHPGYNYPNFFNPGIYNFGY